MDKHTQRKHGVFYTPKIWADYAHERISNILGENWKEEYVVWDNCAGTCNLTKDYKFKELYISTLFDSEVEEGMQFNPEAEHFQFDFLNDEIPNPGSLFNSETKIPDRLLDAFKKNKKIMFLINPPYATSGNIGKANKEMQKSEVLKTMLNNKVGRCSANLYAQFLYRIEDIKQKYNLTNLYISCFTPINFLTSPSYKLFRKDFLKDFQYLNGFQFQASHFADVASNWGIGFTIWKSGESSDKENFEIDICDVNKDSYTGDISVVNKKDLYNIDNKQTARDWVTEPVKKIKTIDAPNFKSGLVIKQKATSATNPLGKLAPNALGFFYNDSNNVNQSTQFVGLFSSVFSGAVGCSILPSNFERVVSLFSVRKLIMPNWINSKDEYLVPDETNPKFKEFVNDSIIFSLFHSASQQSSLRNIEYKNKEKNNE